MMRPFTSATLVCACAVILSGSTRAVDAARKTDLQFLTREGCLHTPAMRDNLEKALQAMRWRTGYLTIDAGRLPLSDSRGGYGTPTVLYKLRDLFGMPTPAVPHDPPT